MIKNVTLTAVVGLLMVFLMGFQGAVIATEEAQTLPKTLKIGIILISPVEEPWNTALFQSLERVQKEKPHGVEISWKATENVFPPDAERVLRSYAKTGEYDIIIAHSTFPEAIDGVRKDFNDILFMGTGAGNIAFGGNAYWCDKYVHEPAYLMGIIAGMMTKSGIIGSVSNFPVPNEDAAVNGFVEGAKSVNPDTKHRITYLESWFDPPKGKEAAYAQIAAGADFIFAATHGPFEACREKGVLAFGSKVDQNSLAPDTIVSSSVARWDPSIKYLIDQWWDFKTKGTAYDAPLERVLFFMKDGGSELAPYHNLDSRIPQEVKDTVQKKKQEIMEGKFTVPLNQEKVTSTN